MRDSGYISEMSSALGWKRGAFIVALYAYFDETGHPKDPQDTLFGIGGAIAPRSQWEELELAWKAMLEEQGIQEAGIHMSHLARCRGVFEDKSVWTIDRRNALVRQAISIAKSSRCNRVCVGSAIPLPVIDGVTFEDVYLSRFFEVIKVLLSGIIKDTKSEQIKLIFAAHPEVPHARLAAYFEMWESITSQFGGFAIEDPKSCYPLQFADMVAFITGERLRRENKIGPFYEELFEKKEQFTMFFQRSVI